LGGRQTQICAQHLVQATLAKGVNRQGAGVRVLRVGTGPARLAIVAATKRREARELGTGGTTREGSLDVGPSHATVLLHVGPGDRVGDALVACDVNQPVEQGRGVVLGNRGPDPLLCQVRADPLQIVWIRPLPADPTELWLP
jgi:hypothetical protein